MDWLDIKEFFSDAFKYIVTAIIVIFILVYIISLQQVVGPSMQPNYNDGDILLLNKFIYHFTDIKRGDVVALKDNNSKYLIKRVIGLPKEKIEYKNNMLYVNGKSYKEEFLSKDVVTEDFSITKFGENIIPEDMYLVLGDNRENSSDSRKMGFIKKEDIIGKCFIRIWPLNKIKLVK